MFHKTTFFAICVLLMILLTACTSGSFSDYDIRDAQGLPERFVLHDSIGADEQPSSGECRSPLVDPRNGLTIDLIRSIPGQGDYTVTQGAFGVGENELLRVDCATGAAIGIVRR